MPYFYALSILLSAFLLFQIQPMIGKILLPWFGGTPTVWSTVLLFSQLLLTGGYAYAYWLLGKLHTRRQGILHLILLGISLILLLVNALNWPSPLTPDASWRPEYNNLPIWDILRILLIAIGVPFLLLASNSTLMQSWFHRDNPKLTPYRLYALSNTGSLVALISYPILIEPYLTLRTQAFLWTFGYLVFAVFAGFLAVRTMRLPQLSSNQQVSLQPEPVNKPPRRNFLFWISLAAIATALLMAVTNQITQEVAVIPFLWVLPLTIYLLTFILAFAGGKLYWRNVYLVGFFILTLISGMLINLPVNDIASQLFVFMLLLFVCCMICHNELYALRPEAGYLPSFYLMVALGGALGGIFVALISPLLFSTGFWELQWSLIATVVLLTLIIYLEGQPRRMRKPSKSKQPTKRRLGKVKPIVVILIMLILIQVGYVVYEMDAISEDTLWARRNFYGVLRVWEINDDTPDLLAYQLTHGGTAHGFQFDNEQIRPVTTAYFTPTSGLGLSILNHPAREDGLKIGVLGLGIGIIGGYGEPNDQMRFYEVNPDVILVAEGEEDYFSYLADSQADIEVVLGDARVALDQELAEGSQNFDVLVLDVFSGDAIPLHLLTKEAFEIYLGHLDAGGIIAINISNRYFDLAKPIYLLADAFDLSVAMIEDRGDGIVSYDSVWMVLSPDQTIIESPAIAERTVERAPVPDNLRLWTDDFSNLIQILK